MATQAKILIVDDEAGIRFSLEETLSRDGYQVTTAESGEAALACVAAQPFDLVLIDLRLPGMSGMEMLTTLRQQAPDTAVVVLTAHASLETAVEALRQGAHDYLFKPCKTVELRDSVRRGLLSRRQKLQQRELLHQLEQHLSSSLQNLRATMTEPPVAADARRPLDGEAAPPDGGPAEEEGRFLRQGGLIVDLTRHVITLDGQLLELSPTEFNLLAYLASEAPRVVSPQELVREVQGYQSETWEASETVRYHVYRLRQKIKEATTGHVDIIRTVRGIGYTLSK